MRPNYTMSDINRNLNQHFIVSSKGNYAITSKSSRPNEYDTPFFKSSSDSVFKPKLGYDAGEVMNDAESTASGSGARKSRFQNFNSADGHNRGLIRRDISMPASRNWDRQERYADDMYESIITTVTAITPPPANIVSSAVSNEYINRKAIIRPLAFKPVAGGCAEPGPGAEAKQLVSGAKQKGSPPLVPPHANRKTRKSKAHKPAGGDSSGYYSSGRGANAASSSEMSPFMDDTTDRSSGSAPDRSTNQTSGAKVELYVNEDAIRRVLAASSSRDQGSSPSPHESETRTELQRQALLEAALVSSNCRLLEVQTQLTDVRDRLSRRTTELGSQKELAGQLQREMELRTRRLAEMERALLYHQRGQSDSHSLSTQTDSAWPDPTGVANGGGVLIQMLSEFEIERQRWLEEKAKVVAYQTRLELSYQRLGTRCRQLETQVQECRASSGSGRPSGKLPPAPLGQPCSSQSMVTSPSGSSNKSASLLPHISRIEATEHQASF